MESNGRLPTTATMTIATRPVIRWRGVGSSALFRQSRADSLATLVSVESIVDPPVISMIALNAISIASPNEAGTVTLVGLPKPNDRP